MDINVLRGIITLIVMVFFVVICIQVFSKHNKSKYRKASRMVLEAEQQIAKKAEGKNYE